MKCYYRKKGLTLLSLLMMILLVTAGTGKSVQAAAAKPDAPAVSAETVGPNIIKVSWTGVKNADGYRIYIKDGTKWVKQGDYKSTTRWVKVWGLEPDTEYTFTVRAYAKTDSGTVWGNYDKTGASAVTAPSETKPAEPETKPGTEPGTKPEDTGTVVKPAAPSVAAQSTDWNTIKVSWKGVTGADGYRIYVKNGTKWIKQGDYKSTTRWVKIGGLNFNQEYTFTVRAYTKTDSGNVWGNYDKTGASAVTALSEPELSGVTWTGNGLKVSWKTVNGADGYRIYRKNSPSDKWKLAAQTMGQKQSSYTDETAAKTDSCCYTVKAFRYDGKKKIPSTCNQKGISYSYDAASEKPAAVTKPAAPAVSAETVSQTIIKVSWKGVTGADGYRIYIKNGNKWVKQGDYKSTTRWVKVGGLNPDTKYTFTVRAYTKTDSGNVWGDYDKNGASAVTAR